MIVNLVYFLCAATSGLCTVLLARKYSRTGVRLLLWSALCFGAFTFNNIMVVADQIVYPDLNLTIWRIAPAFIGLVVLIYGLIWDNI